MSTTYWTTLHHHTALPLDDVVKEPNLLLRYNRDAVTLYMSRCPKLHLFEVFIVNVTSEDAEDVCKALWCALYEDDWKGESQYVVECNHSMLRIKQIYNYTGMISLNVIRHNIPEPDY